MGGNDNIYASIPILDLDKQMIIPFNISEKLEIMGYG
jgi:hypothetical protein